MKGDGGGRVEQAVERNAENKCVALQFISWAMNDNSRDISHLYKNC